MKKSTMALAFAVVLAVLAVVAVRQYLVKEKKEIQKATRTEQVLIASETISVDDPLRRSQVESFEIPERCLLDEMVLASDLDRIRGKKPAKEILRGKLLLEGYFRERGQVAKVPMREGQRLITLGVNTVSGVAGLLAPGDIVDVLWTYSGATQAAGGTSESTLTLFTQVVIFAVDDVTAIGWRAEHAGRGRGRTKIYNTVTLVLYPLECELITFARSQGGITLTKRLPSDGSAPPSPGVDSSHLSDLIDQARGNRDKRGGR